MQYIFRTLLLVAGVSVYGFAFSTETHIVVRAKARDAKHYQVTVYAYDASTGNTGVGIVNFVLE